MKTNHVATILVSASIALGACGGATPTAKAPAASAAPLDGQEYAVTLAFPDEAPMKDTLRFQGGRFESTACTAVGFPQWSDYRAETAPGAIAFAALTRSADGTTMDWKGTVTGETFEGSATRTLSGRIATASVRGSRR
jgi:hypothetical protein